jgi:hypothetical protein
MAVDELLYFRRSMSQVTPFPSDHRTKVSTPTADRERTRRPVTPEELVRWLEEHRDGIADRWLVELRSRSDGLEGSVEDLLKDFLQFMVECLPHGMGVYRDHALSIFHQAAELYGNLGAIRGLAAGEAVEEVQLLREVILRFLFQDPPGGGGVGLGLRELLQLSRLIDQGVTHASVGHTDSLFFNLFHGTGVPEAPPADVVEEVQEQIRVLRRDLKQLTTLEAHEAFED